jgi:hypothetical protein
VDATCHEHERARQNTTGRSQRDQRVAHLVDGHAEVRGRIKVELRVTGHLGRHGASREHQVGLGRDAQLNHGRPRMTDGHPHIVGANGNDSGSKMRSDETEPARPVDVMPGPNAVRSRIPVHRGAGEQVAGAACSSGCTVVLDGSAAQVARSMACRSCCARC